MEVNRRYWDSLVPVHAASRFYDVSGFLAGGTSLLDIERRAVGDVDGKTLLHLQSHFGLDTLSWARLGADVVGVDFSPVAVAEARRLAEEAGLWSQSNFEEGNVLALRSVVDGKFDVVFTSHGTITWLADLRPWAEGIARSLKPDGFFYIVDTHPAGLLFEADGDGALMRQHHYFHREEPLLIPKQPDYADPSHSTLPSFAWIWSLADVFGALEQAGLSIYEFREYPKNVYRQFPSMQQDLDGYWRLTEGELDLPLLFSLKAKRRS